MKHEACCGGLQKSQPSADDDPVSPDSVPALGPLNHLNIMCKKNRNVPLSWVHFIHKQSCVCMCVCVRVCAHVRPQKEMSLTSLYWCSVSVLAHLTNDIASVLVWLSRSLSLHRGAGGKKKNQGNKQNMEVSKGAKWRDDWMDGLKRDAQGGKKEERKEGRKKGCQYISFLRGPGYTKHFKWLSTSQAQQEV